MEGSLRAAWQRPEPGHQRYCDEVVEQTRPLRSVVTSGVPTRVPACPGWTVDQLVRHAGGAVCWVELMVRTQAMENAPQGEVRGYHGPDEEGPEALDDWLAGTAVVRVRSRVPA